MTLTVSKKRLSTIAISLGTSMSLLLPPVALANASMPDMGVFENAVEVSDQELAGMKGRFMDSTQIVNFGVEMTTNWLTTGGDLVHEELNLFFDLGQTSTTQFSPVLTIYRTTGNALPNGTSSGPSSLSTQSSINAAGLDNISGVAQSILVAGDTNSVDNEVSVNISDAGNGQTANGTAGGTTMASGTSSFQGDNGASTTYTVADGVVGFEISLPEGGGRVIQQIRGGQGIFQSVQLTNSMNQIENHFNLNIGVSSSPNESTTTDFANIMQTIRGLPQIGNP